MLYVRRVGEKDVASPQHLTALAPTRYVIPVPTKAKTPTHLTLNASTTFTPQNAPREVCSLSK
jgi:hypothetical protein